MNFPPLLRKRVLTLDGRNPKILCDSANSFDQALISSIQNKNKDYVLYVMSCHRRWEDNAALAFSMYLSDLLKKPLKVIEALSSTYPWASQRHHQFILQGMWDKKDYPSYEIYLGHNDQESIAKERCHFWPDHNQLPEQCYKPIDYPWNFPVDQAVAIVGDWSPVFLHPNRALGLQRYQKPLFLVDDCGMVPTLAWTKAEYAARFIRPKIVPFQKDFEEESIWIKNTIDNFKNFIKSDQKISSDPIVFLEDSLKLAGVSSDVKGCDLEGGPVAARKQLERFLSQKLKKYEEERNHPDFNGTSRLSAYLHHGHLHCRTIIRDLKEYEGVEDPKDFSLSAQKFIDELIAWREIGLNMAHYAYHAQLPLGHWDLIPPWAQKTLIEHPSDEVWTLKQMEEAQTSDEIWNCTQRELLQTGLIHNYMRMLWGKGILKHSRTPQEALKNMEYLNNKYALDGRDANSYVGIYWCLGKFDRPWPPARPGFGIVRSMSTKMALKKLEMQGYCQRFSSSSIFMM